MFCSPHSQTYACVEYLAQRAPGKMTSHKVVWLSLTTNELELVGLVIQHWNNITIRYNVEGVLVHLFLGHLWFERSARDQCIGPRKSHCRYGRLRASDHGESSTQRVTSDLDSIKSGIILQVVCKFSCESIERYLLDRLRLQSINPGHNFYRWSYRKPNE